MNTGFSLRKPCTNKTLGIEIEMALAGPMVGTLHRYTGFFFHTSDGSINIPTYRWSPSEFVSQPLPAAMLKRAINKLYLKIGAPTNFQTNRSCGIHVHVSRKWLGKKQASVLKEFIGGLSLFDFEFLFGREPNDYCETREMAGRGWIDTNRYLCVNLTNKATVEFRMFKSGDANWAKYCVDMVTYMVENSRQINLDALYAFSDMKKKEYNIQ